jgi:exopolyphosphatase/guanosine-5'-triphosphate,3'-diphosphate pyrophosphatase
LHGRLPDDPPICGQLISLRRHVNATLREVADRLLWEGTPDRAVGTSKTLKQLARLTGAPARQRAKLRGISRPRAQQIIAGALVARAAMKAVNVRSVEISPWALREGIILHYLQTTLNESFVLPLRPLPGAGTAEGVPASARHGSQQRPCHSRGAVRNADCRVGVALYGFARR